MFVLLVKYLTRRWRISGGWGIFVSGRSICSKPSPGEPTASSRGGYENIPTCCDDSGVVRAGQAQLHVLRSPACGALVDTHRDHRHSSSQACVMHRRLGAFVPYAWECSQALPVFCVFAAMQHPEPTACFFTPRIIIYPHGAYRPC